MKTLFESRASTILYYFLLSYNENKPFLMPSNICPIVPITFLKAGKPFEFVDISLTDLCISQHLVLERLRNNPGNFGGVLYVHTYGLMNSPDDFFAQIKNVSNKLLVIDDRCLCIPEFDIKTHPDADLILYSTGYSKFVDIGFGGYAFMNDGLKYEKYTTIFDESSLEMIMTNYKKVINNRSKYIYTDTNWLDTSKPAVSFADFKNRVEYSIPHIKRLKESINAIYSHNIPKEYQLKPEQQNWRFNIFVPKKAKLLDRIFAEGLFASSHYDSLDGIFSNGKSTNSEILSASIINLFNDRYFNEVNALKVAKIVTEHLRNYDFNNGYLTTLFPTLERKH